MCGVWQYRSAVTPVFPWCPIHGWARSDRHWFHPVRIGQSTSGSLCWGPDPGLCFGVSDREWAGPSHRRLRQLLSQQSCRSDQGLPLWRHQAWDLPCTGILLFPDAVVEGQLWSSSHTRVSLYQHTHTPSFKVGFPIMDTLGIIHFVLYGEAVSPNNVTVGFSPIWYTVELQIMETLNEGHSRKTSL